MWAPIPGLLLRGLCKQHAFLYYYYFSLSSPSYFQASFLLKFAFLWLFVPIYFPALGAKYATETNFIHPYGYCSSADMQIPAFIHALF